MPFLTRGGTAKELLYFCLLFNKLNTYGFLIVVFILATVVSCSSTKRAMRGNGTVRTLDTVEVVASRENPYRGFATKYFDLINTKLEVSFNYAKQYLYGKATLTMKPHFYPQTEVVLDAKGFDIHEVSLLTGDTKQTLSYTYDSLLLKIKLPRTYTRGEKLNIYIDYTAKPNERKSGGSLAITDDKGLYFINPLGTDTTKPTQIWTQGETESNSCWFPTFDKPDQKATDEILITHLKKYVSLSNGVLASSRDVNDSLVTDDWKMDLPHAPYLVMMAIGDFAIVKDHWRNIPVDYYVEKPYAPYARQIFGNTPEMIGFFSKILDYNFAWPKYAQVVVRDYVSGAMENTTATLHGEFIERNSRELLDETYEDVISHELFHQWFGDLVTCISWSNIPLNESFATYGEYLWNEHKYGREYADFKGYEDRAKYLEESKIKNVNLIRYHYEDREDMFDRTSYEKGGLVLHYLRKCIGDDAFFASLHEYLKNNEFKPVQIANLRLAVEDVTGMDMNWFFDEWFLNSGHPVLDIKYDYSNDSAFVTVSQKHNTEDYFTYQLPAQIGIWHGDSVKKYDVVLKKKSQTFAFPTTGKPDLVDFDAERSVLCEKTENKTTQNYIFQYRHTPLFVQKIEALKQLAEAQKSDSLAKQTLMAALKDSFYYLREYAIRKLNLKEGNDSLAAIFSDMALHDKISSVREQAINKLNKAANPEKYINVFETAVGDSSYEVEAAALKALDNADPKQAMQLAKQLDKEKNTDVAGAVEDIYSNEGGAEYQAYFENKLRATNGIGKFTLLYYYGNFLTRMDKDIVLKGIKTIEQQADSSSDSHFILGAAKGALKRIVKSFEDQKKKAQTDLGGEDKTKKAELQQDISDDQLVINETNNALARLNKMGDDKDE